MTNEMPVISSYENEGSIGFLHIFLASNIFSLSVSFWSVKAIKNHTILWIYKREESEIMRTKGERISVYKRKYRIQAALTISSMYIQRWYTISEYSRTPKSFCVKITFIQDEKYNM